jgi:hypothetical protein
MATAPCGSSVAYSVAPTRFVALAIFLCDVPVPPANKVALLQLNVQLLCKTIQGTTIAPLVVNVASAALVFNKRDATQPAAASSGENGATTAHN